MLRQLTHVFVDLRKPVGVVFVEARPRLQGADADGEETEDGRWQLRLWWKPFAPLIWLGGILVALGGLLALAGRLASDVRRLVAKDKIAYRRMRQGR